MAGDPAELAYGHALAMLGDPDAAAEVAALALRRAGRARGAALGHARQEAVARAAHDTPVDIDSLQTLVLDLPALAATLASTRPPEERAALDVRVRTGGDIAALGAAVGMRPTAAVDKTNEIAELWERSLDPALLAFSGPGECGALADLLAGAAPDTVAKLLATAPDVHAHVAACTTCTDRMRAMTPVRSFFSDAAIEVPDVVREAGHLHRTKRPSAPPAPLFADDARSRRIVTPWRIAAAVTALLVVGAVVGPVTRETDPEANALTRVAAATGLRLEAQTDGATILGLRIHNETGRPMRYALSSPAAWLRLSPADGVVPAGKSASIATTLTDDAPEGAATATVTLQTPSGATYSQAFTWQVERAPDLATTLDGCAVNVTVIDDGDLASLVLHWRDTAEHSVDIANDAANYVAELRPDNGPVTYWVTASDNRGNNVRTADEVINPGDC